MNTLAWLPILFVAIIAIPAVLGLDARKTPPFRSFRERMMGRGR
jgi:hypothetical protein